VSDKPIHAEIVRADQVKVGDTVLLWGQPLKILSIKAESGLIHTEYKDSDGEIHSVRFGLEGRVARILPEPVEVREYWRIKYERFAIIDGKECWLNGAVIARDTGERALEALENRYPANREHIRNPIIEHVRETVLSREEVRND
jgi:hypothetical protein